MDDKPADHLTQMVAEAAAEVAGEMWDRIEGDISDKDGVAIGAALSKVAVETARLTSAEIAAKVAESGAPVQLHLAMDVLDYDEWAERYGHGD
jgi:hypothetical protein